jgi:hypothetical protein
MAKVYDENGAELTTAQSVIALIFLLGAVLFFGTVLWATFQTSITGGLIVSGIMMMVAAMVAHAVTKE